LLYAVSRKRCHRTSARTFLNLNQFPKSYFTVVTRTKFPTKRCHSCFKHVATHLYSLALGL